MGQTTFDVPAGKVNGDVGVLNTKVGDLSSLTTTAKTNLVGAINEIDSDVSVLSGNITTLNTKLPYWIRSAAKTVTTNTAGFVNIANEFNLSAQTAVVIGVFATSSSYSNGIICLPLVIGSTGLWAKVTDQSMNAIISKSIGMYVYYLSTV